MPPDSPTDYTPEGDTVIDNVTHLRWQKQPAPAGLTWTRAKAYCASLHLGGLSGWRLPSRIELLSLVDTGRTHPAINARYFPGTPFTRFWTSTTAPGSTPNAWYVNFGDGALDFHSLDFPDNVRCVR